MMTAHGLRLWRAFTSLDPEARGLVVEAAMLLGFVSIGLRTMPFGSLRRTLDRYAARRPRERRSSRSDVGWAVNAAGRRLPGRTCLIEALAADVMLRRRGYEPRLQLGVRKSSDPSRPVDAHAWIECDGEIVVGGLDTLALYTLQRDADPGRDR